MKRDYPVFTSSTQESNLDVTLLVLSVALN